MGTTRLTRDNGVAFWLGRPLPPGPWHSEPDREEFRHASGLTCLLQRGPQGAWCGYVAVPPGHPWHGVEYQQIDDRVDVHGGLTYSESCQGNICHVPEPGEPDDVWWLGFDCNHSGDKSLSDIADGRDYDGSYKPLGYVKLETMDLAAQVAAASAVR